MPKLPANGYPSEHPFNKDNFRYFLAEPDPHAPYKQEFDENQDLAGKPIPGWFFRKLCPPSVSIAMHDRAPQLKISEDRMSVTGEKGYCMTRATHGVRYGTYYYEISIVDQPEGSHCRLGWSQNLGNLQGPCGYDKFSYSWRSRKGTVFHDSHGKHFAEEGFGVGDTIGFMIHLPTDEEGIRMEKLLPRDESKENSLVNNCSIASSTRHVVNRPNFIPRTLKDRPLVKFKSYLYFELKDEVNKVAKTLRPLKGSKIICFKNGKEIGIAFSDIFAGSYFPCASLYKGITVSFNFGPDFKYPPPSSQPTSSCPDIKDYKGVYEAADEYVVHHTLSDALFFAEKLDSLKVSDLINTNFTSIP